MLTTLRERRIIAHMAIQAGGGGFLDDEHFMLPNAHWLTKVPAADPNEIRLYMGCVN